MTMELNRLTISEAAEGLRRGQWSSIELAGACLNAAEKSAGTTNSWVEVDRASALVMARAADRRLRDGKPLSPLDGIPLGVKDNILVAGLPCTAASNILKGYVAPYDATVVSRLKAAGAVILGKTNMDEFAMGSSTESSCHGPTRNPWDLERIPGGSSGGSAAAVAESSCLAALGTDTGGSIRQPASMCGVVGIKPTYGRVSRYGAIAMASSLDQIGSLGRTVSDAAEVLKAMAGHDVKDSTSVKADRQPVAPDSWPTDLKGLKVGLPREYFVSGMDSGVERLVRGAVAKLRDLGAEIVEVSLPHADYALAVYYVLMPSEVSANLARFDGVRYGSRAEAESLFGTYFASRGRGFGAEVRRRILIGTYALSSGYYDAYYLQALKVRRLIHGDFAQAFTEADILVTPTSPTPAWKLGEKTDDPLKMYLSDIYTVSVNVTGVPALSMPCGPLDGLPVGIQLIGRHFDEARLIGAAHALETSLGRLNPPTLKK
jgi:aspartyl-tRNA(Asn)/glutamyl-tRNA(Gln) amidotransferase subunit A